MCDFHLPVLHFMILALRRFARYDGYTRRAMELAKSRTSMGASSLFKGCCPFQENVLSRHQSSSTKYHLLPRVAGPEESSGIYDAILELVYSHSCYALLGYFLPSRCL